MTNNIRVFCCIHHAVKSSARGFSEDLLAQAAVVRQKPLSVENLSLCPDVQWEHFCVSSVLFILGSAQDLTAQGPEQPAPSRALDSKGPFLTSAVPRSLPCRILCSQYNLLFIKSFTKICRFHLPLHAWQLC